MVKRIFSVVEGNGGLEGMSVVGRRTDQAWELWFKYTTLTDFNPGWNVSIVPALFEPPLLELTESDHRRLLLISFDIQTFFLCCLSLIFSY